MQERIRYAVPSGDTVNIYTLHISEELRYLERNVNKSESHTELVTRRILREMDSRTAGLDLPKRFEYERHLKLMGWHCVKSGYDEEHLPLRRTWWMIENCKSGFARSGSGTYWFEDDTDAAFFKLSVA